MDFGHVTRINEGGKLMTDSDGEKLDKIIWKLDRLGEGLASIAIQIQNLSAAILRGKNSPEPPPEPPKPR